ncbi:hypothetical protein ACEWY4_027536 [Coilia grayii]|uniref:SGNH hydrolase-type esterase domain-containing protein n=1 Tax=Coilia grayii TaxID=363190 RepID=A0ABD1IQH2_9TELE
MDTLDCSCRGPLLLHEANMVIDTLKRDIRRLTNDLARKDTLISAYGSTLRAQAQSQIDMSFQAKFPEEPATTSQPACSTPQRNQPWTEVVARRQRGVLRRFSPPPFNLSNRYSVLADSNVADPAHAIPLPPQHRSAEQSSPKPPAPRRVARERPRHPLSSTRPVAVLIGSSMVRHVTLPRSETWCLPGARVEDVQTRVPEVVEQHPTASAIVVHVGSNVIRLQQSEKLKSDFTSLIQTILATGKRFIVSGPIPSACFSDMQFSRIRQLHVWLMGHCSHENVPFVDNFGSFWRRHSLFARDGRHLNRAGASLLASNLELALEAHHTPH